MAAVDDIDGLSVVSPDHFYASFNTNTTTVPDGVGVVADNDVVEYNAGTWSLFFDGAALGTGTIDALHVDGTDIYFSTAGNTSVPGVGGVADDADIYLWDGAAFSRVWDGSAALPTGGGLTSTGDPDIDGLSVVSPTSFYVSFNTDGVAVPGVGIAQDEDILLFDGGVWSLFFDGTTNGLTTADHDIDAVHIGSVLAPDVTAPTVVVSSPVEAGVVGCACGDVGDGDG